MKLDELDALIDDCLEGRLTEAHAAQLSALLQESKEARARYWEAAAVHGLLENSLQQASLRVITGEAGRETNRSQRRLTWRPLAAAAAGLVFGLFSASIVFGFVAPSRLHVLTLLKEGFEDAAMARDRGVPSRVEVWSGDLLAPQEAVGDVKPAEGVRMVTLPPVEKRKFSYAFRFVDLTKLPVTGMKQSRQIEVTAQFHSSERGMSDRFQIRLAAFAEEAAEAREIWVRDHVDEQALMHVVKTVKTKRGDDGWMAVRSVMDVPAEARVLLVSLASAAGDNDSLKTTHYLDDVQVRLITQDAVLP